MATLEATGELCSLAVSKNGRWIAAGSDGGDVLVWDATTYERVITHEVDPSNLILAVDFSPDSTRLVSGSTTAIVWDVAHRKEVQKLSHCLPAVSGLLAVKYSPQGDRIATASEHSIKVWDSIDGDLLVDIPVTVTPWHNGGLRWFNNFLYVISDSAIKRFEASQARSSLIWEWPVPDSNSDSCIAIPQNGEFIAYSTKRTLTFWDTSTRTQLGTIQFSQDIRSIALSPGDQFLAIGGDNKITIQSLSFIPVSIVVGITAYLNKQLHTLITF